MLVSPSCLLLLFLFLPAHSTPLNESCPEQCLCQMSAEAHGFLINCSKKKLRSIPTNISLEAISLSLHANAIRTLHDSLPSLPALESLDLSDNRVVSLAPPPIFENFTSLQRLNLNQNSIESLLHGSFIGLQSLTVLELSGNQIVAIDENAFEGLARLRRLSLAANKIASVRPGCFSHLLSLQFLSLAENRFSRIDISPFKALQSLRNLSIAANILSSLSAGAFDGLRQLRQLDLSSNSFSEVTTRSLSALSSLRTLIMDANPLKILRKRSFVSLPLSEIHLNRMNELMYVDPAAFYDLPQLNTLNMQHNRKMSYIDSDAFVLCGSLRQLHVNNCSLRALPSTLLRLPNMSTISLYDNPLHCDCTTEWIRQMMVSPADSNHSAISFVKPDLIRCKSPDKMAGVGVVSLSRVKLEKSCSPKIIRFFNGSDQLEIGRSITYPCRAIGEPPPHIHWILSNGKILNGTSNYSRLKLSSQGTLSIEHLKPSDAGKYTCVASNAKGDLYDTATTVLKIHNKDIRIQTQGVATNFITVTWSGTGSTIQSSDYLLLFRERETEEEYHTIDLRPYMRSYTITNLQPRTAYEFCIAFRHAHLFQKLNCTDIQTKHQMFVLTGVRSMGNLSIFIAIIVMLALVGFLCFATLVIKRYKRRKSYQEPEGENVPQRLDTMSQIPLDNIYNPPSTPLCASTSSLIPTSSA